MNHHPDPEGQDNAHQRQHEHGLVPHPIPLVGQTDGLLPALLVLCPAKVTLCLVNHALQQQGLDKADRRCASGPGPKL